MVRTGPEFDRLLPSTELDEMLFTQLVCQGLRLRGQRKRWWPCCCIDTCTSPASSHGTRKSSHTVPHVLCSLPIVKFRAESAAK